MSTGPIVIKIGGAALEAQREASSLWRALLALATRTPGGLVLVHGGGKAVDRLLEKLAMPTTRRDGLRITPPEQMDVIAGVLAGSTNKSIVGGLLASAQPGQPRAVGLCLGDGGAFVTRTLTGLAFDPGRVGEVLAQPTIASGQPTAGDGALVRTLLGAGYLPVIACVGLDSHGQFLNVNGDDAAAGVARALGASRLALLTDVAGIKDASGSVLPRVSSGQVRTLIEQGVVTGGMLAKVRAATTAAEALRIDVTIMAGDQTQPLEDWALGRPAGTTITPGG